MNVNNPAKLVGICVIVVCATIGLGLGKLDAVAYVALVGPLGGYLVGNGVAARRSEPVEPIIGARRPLDLPPPRG